jgi:hypothetical protein
MVYGSLAADRLSFVRSLSTALGGDELMRRIYSVCAHLGFPNLAYCDEADQATLAFVEQYVKFKQGEVWTEIDRKFRLQGIKPTAADRQVHWFKSTYRGMRLSGAAQGTSGLALKDSTL